MSSSVNQNILNTAMDLIQLKLKDTMLNLAYDMCDLHLSSPEKDIPESIAVYFDKVRDYTKNLTDILKSDLSQRTDVLHELSSLRNDYAKVCLPIYLYISVLNQAGSYGMWQYKCKSAEQMPVDNYHAVEHSIRDYIDEFISSAVSPAQKHFNMSKIISLVPIRLTRERFNDLVSEGLKATLADADTTEANTAVRLLTTSFYPMGAEGYGSIMPDTKTLVDELYSRQIDSLTSDELESYLGEIDSAMDELSELADYLNIVYNDINYLISLVTFCIDEEYLTDEDILLKDVLYSCKDMLESNDYDLYADALAEKISDRIEDSYPELRDKDKKLSEYVDRYIDTDKVEDDAMNAISTYINIHTLYQLELSDEFTSMDNTDDAEPVSDNCINEKINDLLSFIAAVPDSISIAKNKFFRKEFLGSLPVIMSDDDFNAYLDYAFDPIRGKSSGVAAITDICDMLTAEGVIPDENYEDEHEHCSCGHHHSHEHSHCSCGHDHDHKHSHLHVIKNDNHKKNTD